MIQDYVERLRGQLQERRDALVTQLINSGANHDLNRGQIKGLDSALDDVSSTLALFEVDQ